MNISCNEDSGFDVVAKWIDPERLQIKFRLNHDDNIDTVINYIFSKEDVIDLRDYLSSFVGE